MLRPAGNLPGKVIARFAEIAKTDRLIVDIVQCRHGAVFGFIDCATTFGRVAGQQRLPENAAFHHIHHVKHGADNAFVLTHAERFGHGIVNGTQCRDNLVLPVNRMSGGEKLSRGLATQNIFLLRRYKLIGRVGLPTLELADFKWTFKTFHMRGEIVGEAFLVKTMLFHHRLGAGKHLLLPC